MTHSPGNPESVSSPARVNPSVACLPITRLTPSLSLTASSGWIAPPHTAWVVTSTTRFGGSVGPRGGVLWKRPPTAWFVTSTTSSRGSFAAEGAVIWKRPPGASCTGFAPRLRFCPFRISPTRVPSSSPISASGSVSLSRIRLQGFCFFNGQDCTELPATWVREKFCRAWVAAFCLPLLPGFFLLGDTVLLPTPASAGVLENHQKHVRFGPRRQARAFENILVLRQFPEVRALGEAARHIRRHFKLSGKPVGSCPCGQFPALRKDLLLRLAPIG